MRRTRLVAIAATSLASAALALATTPAGAAPSDTHQYADPGAPALGKVVSDVFDQPWQKKYDERNQAALEKQIRTGGTGDSVKLGKGKYGRVGTPEQTDKIFVVLAEFGNTQHSAYSGQSPDAQRVDGPLHNQIPEPDRTVDNSTNWQPDYTQAHYQNLYFNRMKKFYEQQSSGHYSVDGTVTDWVKVPFNEARYGRDYCGDIVCSSTYFLIRDALAVWVDDQIQAGKTMDEITTYLKTFDQQDRYDFDGDGNFNEPDGYIDHFQIVHAGEDESAGGGAQGTDAIWAHRWYAFGTDAGATGPADNKLGGTQVGDTGIWVGDYTMQPENGGLGVYAHEYGHDLGLPDEYDTNGGENSTGFWTLMSSGSWLGTGKEAIGDLPGDMNAWDKLQLGWLNYDVAKAGTKSSHKLGVAEYNTENKQATVVTLPDKAVTTTVVTPAQGSTQWWSGSDNLKNTLTRDVDLTGKSSATLNLDGWYDIESGYDYLYTEVSTDGGANWTALDGTANGAAIPRDGSDKPALTGSVDAYTKLSYPLDAYAGQKIQLRFRYQTDGGVALKGFAADEITLTADGSTVFADNAESADAAWTASGFSRIGASFTKDYAQYYIAENRQYVSYDETLKTGPYNFGFSTTRPDWVEHYPYQNGLLIWKWDTSEADDNTSVHPGTGLILPIDSHPTALKWSDGTLMRNRIQAYDSPFSLYATDGITLHKADVATKIRQSSGVSVFNDHKSDYYDASNPAGGVKITDTNTKINIVTEAKDGSTISLQVGPAVK
jgi:immune inhibitor A